MGESKYRCPICGEWRDDIRFHLISTHAIRNPNISGEGTYTRVITYTQPQRNGTMSTEIAPVTEAEMTSLFQRVTSSFASLTSLGREHEELKGRFAMLEAELQQVRETNSRLLSERDSAITKELDIEARLKDIQLKHDNLSERNAALNDNILMRDGRVAELNGKLTSAQLAVDDEKRAHEYTKGRIEHIETDLQLVRERRNHFQDRAEKAEEALAEAQAKLEVIQKQVKEVFGLVTPVPVVETPSQPVEVAAPPSDPTTNTADTSVSPPTETSVPVSTTEPTPAVSDPPKPWWEQSVSEQSVA